ncbi:HD domain-containing phosphohydrolase [Thermodesulfovibrio sp.]|uniref:HD domain-containing phosphohydrolase n=1 Tax=Thermodesulfovibrio sp. TaxID=2067987 RepID=UPI003C7A3344
MEKEIFSEHFRALLEFSAIINSSLEIEEIRKRACKAIIALVNCEAASLLLFDKESEELYFDVALGEKAHKVKTIRLKLGQGIAGWVAQKKQAVIINDVQNDPRFFRGGDEKSGFTTKTMICLPVMIKEKLLGVIQAINKKNGFFNEYDLELLKALSSQVAVAIENARLYDELKQTFYEIVFALADTIEKRDPYTAGHTKRVMDYSVATAIEMGLGEEEIEKLKLAAILHDIGKIGIRDSILLKTERLTDEEYKIIQNHAIYGAEILQHVRQLKDIIPGVKYHHEKFDGSGYPERLKAQEIPLIARIIAVADTFDAMTTDRPYRKGMSIEAAIQELKNNAATQFDSEVVEAFLKALNKMR